MTHDAWLAEGPEDPRPALAERLVAAWAGTPTVVAYNAPFEAVCLQKPLPAPVAMRTLLAYCRENASRRVW